MGGAETPAGSEKEETFAERKATMGSTETPAEMPAQGKATVTQVTDPDAPCNEAPAKSEPLQDSPAEGGLGQAYEAVRQSLLRMGFDPLIE
jgi:hypothetical protein